MITSGIMLNLFVVSAIYRPATFYTRVKRKNINNVLDTTVNEPKDSKNNSSPLKKNNRLASSQPLLQTQSSRSQGTTFDLNEKSRSLSTNIENCVQEDTESIAERLSHSTFVKYLGNSAMDLQSLDYGSKIISTNNVESKTTFCGANSKLCPFDASFFKDLPFMLNTIGFCFGCQVIGVAPVYIAPFSVEKGIEVKNAALLLSVVGGADFVSRLLSGYLADLNCIKKQYMVAISQGIVCVVMNLVRFCENFWTFVIFSVMTGFFGGISIGVNPTLILDTTGIGRHRSGVAIYNLATGMSLGITTPLLGKKNTVIDNLFQFSLVAFAAGVTG